MWMLRGDCLWRLNREVLLRISLHKSPSTAQIHTAKTSKLELIEYVRTHLRHPRLTYHRGQDPDTLTSQPSTHFAWY